MRQSGMLAAAALHGLAQHRDRLAEDHANARLLAEAIAGSSAVELDLASVQTNIVIFRLKPGAPDAATIVAAARERGVLISAFAARTVRAVTHLNVSQAQARQAGQVLAGILG